MAAEIVKLISLGTLTITVTDLEDCHTFLSFMRARIQTIPSTLRIFKVEVQSLAVKPTMSQAMQSDVHMYGIS